MGILKHIPDVAVQPQLTSLTVIFVVDEDSSLSGLKETAGQVHQVLRRLTQLQWSLTVWKRLLLKELMSL